MGSRKFKSERRQMTDNPWLIALVFEPGIVPVGSREGPGAPRRRRALAGVATGQSHFREQGLAFRRALTDEPEGHAMP